MFSSAFSKVVPVIRPVCLRRQRNALKGAFHIKNAYLLNFASQSRGLSVSRMLLNNSPKDSESLDQGLFPSKKIDEFKSHPMFTEILKHPDLLQELKITLDMMKMSNSKSSSPSFAQAIKLLADPTIRKQLEKVEKLFEEKNIKMDRSLLKAFMS